MFAPVGDNTFIALEGKPPRPFKACGKSRNAGPSVKFRPIRCQPSIIRLFIKPTVKLKERQERITP
jgi:hypothetical protein